MSNVSPLHAATAALARQLIACAALASGEAVELSVTPHPHAADVVRAVVESTDASGGEYLRSAVGATVDGALRNLLATVQA